MYVWLRFPPYASRGIPTLERARLAHAFDGWPLGGIFRAVFEPLTMWDGLVYVALAQGGYSTQAPFNPASPAATHAAFFPLYPALVRVVSFFRDSAGAALIAAYVVSFAAFFAALYLLHRLTTIELGSDAARATLLLMAFAPTAFVFGAPYTESLFLLCSVGAVYSAREGRWAWAGIAAAAATLTRNSGLFLIVPLVVMYLWGPRADAAALRAFGRLRLRYRPRLDIAWIALPLAAFAAFSLYLQLHFGDALAWSHGQRVHDRISVMPWTGFWDGATAAWHALTGKPPLPFYDFGSLNVLNFSLFLVACAALVPTFRRLPRAYGLYVLPALIFPLTAPRPDQPLMAVPRYLLVLFPLFMWAGAACVERRRTELVLGVFVAFFGVLTVQFASGLFTV